MALTVTERGSGGNNTASTSLVIAPASNFVAGTTGVLTLHADNAGSGGATTVMPATITDSKGNTWTRHVNPIYDPGAASAGVDSALYSAPIVTALLTSDNITVNWAAGVSVTAKRWELKEIAAGAGNIAQHRTSGAGTGAASGTPTVTTASVTSGEVVVGFGTSESADTWVGDSDTSNGSWSTAVKGAAGTGTSGIAGIVQHKVTTGTATQTYNPTLTSADQILGWAIFQEVASAVTAPINKLAYTLTQKAATATGGAVGAAAKQTFTITQKAATAIGGATAPLSKQTWSITQKAVSVAAGAVGAVSKQTWTLTQKAVTVLLVTPAPIAKQVWNLTIYGATALGGALAAVGKQTWTLNQLAVTVVTPTLAPINTQTFTITQHPVTPISLLPVSTGARNAGTL